MPVGARAEVFPATPALDVRVQHLAMGCYSPRCCERHNKQDYAHSGGLNKSSPLVRVGNAAFAGGREQGQVAEGDRGQPDS